MASYESSAADSRKQLHFVMLPWLAFGHIIPYLELSKFIAQKGHKISFVSTSRNIDRLPNLPSKLSPLISIVKLSLPRLDNKLPENAEATMDVREEDVHHLKKACDGLEHELTKFLEKSAPDWIIMDFFYYWLPPIATRLGASCAYFCINSVFVFPFIISLTESMIDGPHGFSKPEDLMVPPKWITFPTTVAFRYHEAKGFFNFHLNQVSEDVVSDSYRVRKLFEGIDSVIVRHVSEFEHQWLKALEQISKKPVIPVGFIPPFLQRDNDDEGNSSWVSIKKWLDSQEKWSVVYVALGSESTPSQENFTELALGLELSGLPFFWALRKPPGSKDGDFVNLPDGFEERVKDQGVVWKSWAPQTKILAHDSVGGFLTHSGWGSVIEGLTFALPLIMLPFSVDQGLIARVLVEHKVGIEVARDEDSGSYSRKSVADSVRLVMTNQNEGKIMREKAKELSTVFGDKKLNDEHTQNFIEYLENHRSQIIHVPKYERF